MTSPTLGKLRDCPAGCGSGEPDLCRCGQRWHHPPSCLFEDLRRDPVESSKKAQ